MPSADLIFKLNKKYSCDMSEVLKAKDKIKKHYAMKKSGNKRFSVNTNLRGFLCTCNGREKDCIKEAYNILNEYADKLDTVCTEEPEPLATEDDEDISDALSKEVCALKTGNRPNKKRFQVMESGAKNILFVQTTLENPIELGESIVSDIYATKTQKTKFLLRLVPVETTCRAYLADIEKSFTELADKHFKESSKTFSIIYNHRNNNNLSKDEVIQLIADRVSEVRSDHKVNLKAAEVSIIVEVIKGYVFMSVVPNYLKYKKYNLLAAVDENKEEEINTHD